MGGEITKEIYEKIEKGEKVNCLENDCEGIITKAHFKPLTQTTEITPEDIIGYVCSKDKSHYWVYSYSPFNIV